MDNLDDIVFEHRNKSYGAYVLRSRYYKSASYGLLFALLIFISVTIYVYIDSMKVNDYANNELYQEMVDFEQYNTMKELDSMQVNTPPPKKEIAKKDIKSFVVVDKPVNDTLKVVKLPDLKEDSIKNDSLLLADSSKAGSENGKINGKIYTKVDELPEFPGGFSALRKYLLQNTHYPDDARLKHISGIVLVQCVISKNGDVLNVSTKKGINPLLDNEALRVIKSLPKWKPARRKGYAVNMMLVFPIKFLL
ncbi:MAG: TonB family protein [Bacteroidales bacterium]|jgi:protein TonB